MILDAKKMSASIRMKKKKMMSAEPELVDTDGLIDMDPTEHMEMEQEARMENALDSPERIDARNTDMDQSEHDAMTMGETSDEEKRMGRLKRLLDAMDL